MEKTKGALQEQLCGQHGHSTLKEQPLATPVSLSTAARPALYLFYDLMEKGFKLGCIEEASTSPSVEVHLPGSLCLDSFQLVTSLG